MVRGLFEDFPQCQRLLVEDDTVIGIMSKAMCKTALRGGRVALATTARDDHRRVHAMTDVTRRS